MWSTGNFIKPMKKNGISGIISPEGFTAAWADRTALYLSDIEVLPPKTWKKIAAAAMKIVDEKIVGAASRPVSTVQAAKTPLRRLIVDADESE